MKRLFAVSAVALLLAVISYALTRNVLPTGGEEQGAWLQREFKLDAGQLRAVQQLESSYQPVCAEHCRLILEARARLTAAPADSAAQAAHTQLEARCNAATRQHLREIAALMPAPEGVRFLALVEPKVSRQEHEAPLGLR